MEWILAGAAALLVVALAASIRHLRRLIRWLQQGEGDPPRAYGIWDLLNAALLRERREADRRERELRAAADRWQDAARALPDGMVILEDNRIAWCNDMSRLHLDLDPGKDVGRPLTHLLRLPAFSDYLSAEDYSKPVLVKMPISERMLSLQVIPFGESQQLVLSRDVTQLQQLEKMRREFVANVSHELRTPLTVVAGFIETLREDEDDAVTRQYLDLMAAQSDRMRRLVEDLLTLSALESSPPPAMDRVEMEAMVKRLGTEARALSKGRHVIVVECGASFDLLGSDKELSSAFSNLVSNAIRYTPEGGTVTLRWTASPEGAAFEVSDTGIGVPPEHIPRLTERFYRVDRGRSRETGGTGLGLAIVKHALGRHGAALQVTSQPGQGSTFSARFQGARLQARTASDMHEETSP